LSAIIFLWTPPHFLALALYRCRDYANAGVPMLPVVEGLDETRRQILIYSFVLVPVTILPVFIGLAGALYGLVSVVAGGMFLGLAMRVYRIRCGQAADTAAKQLFAFSILYLFLLFAVLLVEHGADLMWTIPGVVVI